MHVWLDGTDVVLGYQALLDVAERGRPHRHAGRGGLGDAGEEHDDNPRAEGGLVGFAPTGEPDVTDPDLVNKLH